MTTFDNREKAFEDKFVHDEEMAFKVIARRNKMLGFWAAGKLSKNGQDAEAYAKDAVLADFERSGNGDIAEKLLGDFTKAGLSLGEKDISAEMERLLPIARKQVMEEK